MKKYFIAAILTIALLFSSLTFISCGNTSDKDSALMTVDINPSVEFVLDENGKVVNVTALNDDGAVILSGEVFVGLSAEEAAEKVVSISIETGFISEEDAKDITLTVSGADIETLYKKVSDGVSSFLSEHDLGCEIKKGQALAEGQLKKLLLAADPTLTEEDIAGMSTNEILEKLGEARKEYAALATEQMRDAYLKFKESKISFAEGEKTAAIIEKLGNAYASALQNYNTMLTQLDAASDNLNKLYYDSFLAEDSAYQTASQKLKTARVQLVSVKNATTAEELLNVISEENFDTVPGIDGIRSALDAAVKLASITPTAAKTAFDSAISSVVPALDRVLSAAESALSLAKQQAESAVKTANDALTSLKSRMTEAQASFPTEIKTELSSKAQELENAVNEAKAKAFSDFETEYREAIERTNSQIAAQKAALKKAVSD